MGFLRCIPVTFWAKYFFVEVEGCPVCCRMFSNIPDLYLQDLEVPPSPVVTDVSRHCQISLGGLGAKIVLRWEPLVKLSGSTTIRSWASSESLLEMQHLRLPSGLSSQNLQVTRCAGDLWAQEGLRSADLKLCPGQHGVAEREEL